MGYQRISRISRYMKGLCIQYEITTNLPKITANDQNNSAKVIKITRLFGIFPNLTFRTSDRELNSAKVIKITRLFWIFPNLTFRTSDRELSYHKIVLTLF